MLANWVRQRVSTIDTNTILLGLNLTGYIPAAFAYSDGDVIHYSIEDSYNRETGIGVYNSNNTITRTQVIETLVGGVYQHLPTAGITLSSVAILGTVATMEGLTSVKPVWNNLLGVTSYVPNTSYLSPDYIPFIDGILVPAFDSILVESLAVRFQLNHDVQVGSDMLPYINWSPSDASVGNVRWCLEYAIADRSTGVFLNTIKLYFVQAASGVVGTNQFVEHDSLNVNAISQDALIMGRIYRDADDVSDTYTGDAFLLGVGMHYLTDKIGTPSKDSDYTVWSN